MSLGGVGLMQACSGTNLDGIDKTSFSFDKKAIDGKVDKRTDTQSQNEISLLGFGCMRYPLIPGTKKIDEDQAQMMVDYAYEHGINYFDTAWPYHNGESETFTGKALKEYPRHSFFLADKMPTWAVNDLQSAKDIFNKQLEKCQVDYFDYYLLHALSKQEDYERVYEQYGVLEYLQKEKAEGHIRQLGFSFHGSLEFFEYLLNKPVEWDFIQIQLNYYDWDDPKQNSGKLYKMLEERNIPVIVMEPIRGGMLARLNDGVVKYLKSEDPSLTPAAWALRYVGSFPAVLTVLSGMSKMEHVEENVYTFSSFKPLTEGERKVLNKALTSFKENKPIVCTDCKYCMPCKFGVNIPGIFLNYNELVGELNVPNPNGVKDDDYFKKRRMFLNSFNNKFDDSELAHRCIGCGKCVSLCPQSINIPKQMREIDNFIAQLKKDK